MLCVQACEVAIVHGNISMCSAESTADNVQYESWQQFWQSALRGVDRQDLPDWPGAPLRAVWIMPFDGNDSCIIAQKDANTYCVVSYGTS